MSYNTAQRGHRALIGIREKSIRGKGSEREGKRQKRRRPRAREASKSETGDFI